MKVMEYKTGIEFEVHTVTSSLFFFHSGESCSVTVLCHNCLSKDRNLVASHFRFENLKK